MKIAVLGAGSWGTTLASIIADNTGKEVILWAREEEISSSIREKRENTKYLPGIKLSRNVSPTSDERAAVSGAGLIVTAIPSQFLRENLRSIKGNVAKECIVINAAKGLELNTMKPMSQVIREELNISMLGVLSGPNHAEEVSRKIPTATVIASKNIPEKIIKSTFECSYFKVYPHDDVIGVEICGAMKNITAIATGIISSLGLGDNASGAIITLGLREMVKVSRHFKGKQETCYGLAGVGDLVATCTSAKSRNRRAGELIAKGYSLEKINEEMHGMVAEGIPTCKAVHEYAEKHDISLPLVRQSYKVIFENKKLQNAIEDLKRLI